MERHSRAPDFVDQFLTGRLKLFQIGRTKLRIGCSRKNQIRHFQIAHRTVIRRRLWINFFRNPKGGFAHFIVRPNVAHNCGINSVAKNHERVIARFRGVASMRERTWNYDVGIGRPDQETELLKRRDFRAQLGDCIAQIALAIGRSGLGSGFIFRAFQSLFGSGKIRIGCHRFLSPLETGERFEVGRRPRASRHPVAIRTVRIDIHVGLQQQCLPMALRMLQLQDSLAIEKIVTREKQVQADKIFAKHSDLGIVKLGKKRRNGLGTSHRGQTGQQLRQSRRYFCQLLECSIRCRNACIQFQIQDITLRIDAFGRCVCAGRSFDAGMKGDTVEQAAGIEFPGDGRRPRWGWLGRWRSCRRSLPGREVLQSFLRNPAIQNHRENRCRQKEDQPSQRTQTKFCHAITF